MNTRQPGARQSGFTLLELAVVILILGLILGSAIQPLHSQLERLRWKQLERDMAQIRDIAMGYALSRIPPSLPCPDCRHDDCASAGNQANDGIEDRHHDDGSCDAAGDLGNLPWVTLAAPAFDPWGSRYSLRVAPVFSNARTGFSLDTPAAGSATIRTRDHDGQIRTLASNVPFLLLSHGPNRRGAINEAGGEVSSPFSGDEVENIDNDARFHSRPTRRQGPDRNRFDDRLEWIGIYELKAHLIRSGATP